MKKLFYQLLILTLGAPIAAKAATYTTANIRLYISPIDQMSLPDNEKADAAAEQAKDDRLGEQWSNRVDFLVGVLLQNAPDVIGIQEGLREQQEDLAYRLGYKLIVPDGNAGNSNGEGKNRRWIPGRMYPTLLVNPATMAVLKSGDVWYSATPDTEDTTLAGSNWPRLFTWALLREKSTNRLSLVVTTHLDEQMKNTARIEEAKILVAEVKRLLVKIPTSRLVVMGDFNDQPHGDVWNTITSGLELGDAWDELRSGESGNTFHNFGKKTSKAWRMDWILVSPSLIPSNPNQITLENYACWNSATAHEYYPSDHYAVSLKSNPLGLMSTPRRDASFRKAVQSLAVNGQSLCPQILTHGPVCR